MTLYELGTVYHLLREAVSAEAFEEVASKYGVSVTTPPDDYFQTKKFEQELISSNDVESWLLTVSDMLKLSTNYNKIFSIMRKDMLDRW